MCRTRKDVMLRKLDKRAELKKKMDELQYELDEVETFIKEAMTADGKDEIMVGPYKVTYKEVTQNRFNSELFKKEYGKEVYESFQKPSTSKRFNVYNS